MKLEGKSMVIDFKKEYKEYYMLKNTPEITIKMSYKGPRKKIK